MNVFLKFLQELFQRLFVKSPKFFQVFQWLTGALTALTGLPAFLQQLGITLPPAATLLENKFIGAVSVGALFMSLLTTQGTTVATSQNGVVLKTTNADKLPFTADTEQKAVAASTVDVPQADNVVVKSSNVGK